LKGLGSSQIRYFFPDFRYGSINIFKEMKDGDKLIFEVCDRERIRYPSDHTPLTYVFESQVRDIVDFHTKYSKHYLVHVSEAYHYLGMILSGKQEDMRKHDYKYWVSLIEAFRRFFYDIEMLSNVAHRNSSSVYEEEKEKTINRFFKALTEVTEYAKKI
jgi:hypothetical protein